MHDHHLCCVITPCHARTADFAPSSAAPRHPVSNMQPASQPSCNDGQASRQVHARLVVAAADNWHIPAHHERISGRRHHTHAADFGRCAANHFRYAATNVYGAGFETICKVEVTAMLRARDRG